MARRSWVNLVWSGRGRRGLRPGRTHDHGLGGGIHQMELAGAFQLGGDVQEAFDYGVDRLAVALAIGPGR